MSTTYSILHYVVICACEKYGHNGNEFTTANFQSELARITNANPMITQQAAELILLSIEGVSRGVSRCYWVFNAPRPAPTNGDARR